MNPSNVLLPRDRLDRMGDLLHKAKRYWKVPMIACLVGGLATLAFALLRKPQYKSWSVITYQERIQSGVLQGRDAVQTQRNVGERLLEMLRARTQLAAIVQDPTINPFPKELAKEGLDVAVEELRERVEFDARGTSTFRIGFRDSDATRAQAVTERLTLLLQAKEEAIRRDQVEATSSFVEKQKAEADAELGARSKKLTEFKTAHPEFAEDTATSQEGAGIRAAKRTTPRSATPRLASLERQAARITARLNAAPGTTVAAPSTDAQRAADRAIEEAQREVTAAKRELDNASASFTERHPDVMKARIRYDNALAKLAAAKTETPMEVAIAPTSAADRQRLEQELQFVRQKIAAERARTPGAVVQDSGVDAIVALETEYTTLRDAVSEQREVVESLNQSAFRARIEAQSQLADRGSRLTLVDPAFRPVKPFGTGRTILMMGGLVLSALIGLGLMFLFALLDDRIYRAGELEDAGLGTVLAEIPAEVP